MRDYEDVGRALGMSLVYGVPLVIMFWPVFLVAAILGGMAYGAFAYVGRPWARPPRCPVCTDPLPCRCGVTMS